MRRTPRSASRLERRVAIVVLALVASCGGGEPPPADDASPSDSRVAPVDTATAGSPGEATDARSRGPTPGEASGRSAFSHVYRCSESFAVAARPRRDDVSLVLAGRDVVLERVASASGARYEGGGVVFWERGDEVRIELPDTVFTACARTAATGPWHEAALRGVTARALGQEPGWIAEVDPDRFLSLELDYGERRILLPAPTVGREWPDTAEATGDARGAIVFRSRTEAHDATLRFVPEACVDAMSGRRSSHTVRLEIDGDVYQGCGRLLSRSSDDSGPLGGPGPGI